MSENRLPVAGDYWCMGLLTADFFEAVRHAINYARDTNAAITVSRYVRIDAFSPLMEDVAVIRKP